MKAIVFDFDGTLSTGRKGSNCWFEIWKYIDDLNYDNFLYDKFRRKEIDYATWFKLVFERYKEKGVKREFLHEISKTIIVLPGTRETLKHLHENGIKIFVLSGGIRQIIEDVLKREKIDKYITSVETNDLIFNDKGDLTGYGRPKLHNPEKKEEYLNLIKKQYNLKSKEILFVGNAANDETAYLSGVKTLCINPDGANISDKKVWNHTIENCENLSQILNFCKINEK